MMPPCQPLQLARLRTACWSAHARYTKVGSADTASSGPRRPGRRSNPWPWRAHDIGAASQGMALIRTRGV